ncbi:MAG: 4-alpha-glucanotransferase [Frankiales bacterium]|nr:4-alpha-glucanotransferase [Frankiales bacterium]
MTDSPALAALAEHYRVATGYENWAGHPVDIADDVVEAVLAALGVDVSDPAATLRLARESAPLLPPTVVVDVGLPAGVDLRGPATAARAELEDGEVRGLAVAGHELLLPADLPPGFHRLVVEAGGGEVSATLIVAPTALPDLLDGRSWGWAAQLYQLRSERSWGVGDLEDLRTLTAWSGAQGADLVLVNPMHAGPPVSPLDPSPYSPSSRRFRAPQYLRPELTLDYLAAPDEVRAQVDALAATVRPANHSDSIDRDASWQAKERALALLFVQPPGADRTAALAGFIREGGEALQGFATYCAIAELHGPAFPDWPAELRDPRAPEVATLRAELADRLLWHCWLQLLCDEQLAAAQDAARESGMRIGVIHDLAVGVTSYGADAWALQGTLAGGLHIGAPPDAFNQRGQDWSLPPWHPTALAEAGYAPFREMIRSVLRHAGGIRIDHMLGLFRLWCIPKGESADRGAFVYYDHRALLGVLLLEAARAGAVVIGEDVGTVAPYVAEELARRHVLGCDLLWFQLGPDPGSGEMRPVMPGDWRELAMASLTTHDLPTAAGFLQGEHVRVRERLGLLRDPDAEWAQARHERAAWLDALRRKGILPPDDGQPVPEETFILGLYEWLGRTPARLLGASLSDVVGDVRQPNLPGTIDEYPSWRLPIADGQGHPQLLEDLMAAPMAAQVAHRLGRSDSLASGNSDLQREL